MKVALKYHQDDNVVTTLEQLERGDKIAVDEKMVDFQIIDSIPVGHKVACQDIAEGEYIIKFGQPVGKANCLIKKGNHVHIDNQLAGTSPTRVCCYNCGRIAGHLSIGYRS
jgi:altronate dehydratase